MPGTALPGPLPTGRHRPRSRLVAGGALLLAGGLTLALTGPAGPASAAVAPAARPAAAALAHDTVTIATAPFLGSPSPLLGGPAASGGIAVDDVLADHAAGSVAGTVTLAGGGTIDVRLARHGSDTTLSGQVTASDPAKGLALSATVSGGVTRTSDQVVTWTGDATVTTGAKTSSQRVRLTIDDLQPDPGTHLVSLTHAGQDRTAFVYVPKNADLGAPVPTLYHFPGLLENADYAEQFEQVDPGADKYGYLLVTPEHYGYGWQGVEVGTPFPDVDDPGYVRALNRVVEQRFGADPHRTYASGMSNGGFFTSLLACTTTDVFAAFAPVSGQVNDTSTCSPGKPQPVVMIHGDADPLVPFSTATDAAAFWARNDGCDATPVDVTLPDADPTDGTTVIRHTYQHCAAGGGLVFYQVVNGGHAWPGGVAYPVDLGHLTKDISANDVIWQFVSQFRLG